MKIKLFYHSLISDWNHGNAHFLRGIVTELLENGHDVEVYEPEGGWSYTNLLKEHGPEAVDDIQDHFPMLQTNFYGPKSADYEILVKDADLVIVHEWNEPETVAKLGRLKEQFHYTLLFHDTHHRIVSAPDDIKKYDLTHYDGVLAFGDVIRDMYLKKGWAKDAWTWHEAADMRLFHPQKSNKKTGDLVWIGNWGDEERTEELKEYLIKPVKELELTATIYGVNYPEHALKLLKDADIKYGGWLPNHRVPEIFSQYKFTVHVPRRYYTTSLPGIPTIRPFEAMACGIPLLSSPWKDSENLFRVNEDFQMVHSGEEMRLAMQWILENPQDAQQMASSGLQTIMGRHTCAHRVEELMQIVEELQNKPESIKLKQ